jgi:hypothetical protein
MKKINVLFFALIAFSTQLAGANTAESKLVGIIHQTRTACKVGRWSDQGFGEFKKNALNDFNDPYRDHDLQGEDYLVSADGKKVHFSNENGMEPLDVSFEYVYYVTGAKLDQIEKRISIYLWTGGGFKYLEMNQKNSGTLEAPVALKNLHTQVKYNGLTYYVTCNDFRIP